MKISKLLILLYGVFLLTNSALASSYDGNWKVEVDCPASVQNKGAREVKFSFTAQIIGGEFSGGVRTLPEPGSVFVKGKIGDKGEALLHVEGYHKDPENNVIRAPVGTIYTYSVRSNFEGTSGKGERITGRDCSYKFTKIISP
jgi:hypothetical protein